MPPTFLDGMSRINKVKKKLTEKAGNQTPKTLVPSNCVATGPLP